MGILTWYSSSTKKKTWYSLESLLCSVSCITCPCGVLCLRSDAACHIELNLDLVLNHWTEAWPHFLALHINVLHFGTTHLAKFSHLSILNLSLRWWYLTCCINKLALQASSGARSWAGYPKPGLIAQPALNWNLALFLDLWASLL